MFFRSYSNSTWTRRTFLKVLLAGSTLVASSPCTASMSRESRLSAQVFIGRTGSYESNLRNVIERGLQELGISATEMNGKKILLKPNLVETHMASAHINTHPLVIRAAVEAFLSLGARQVVVGEGPGHRRDALHILEESGLGDVLYEDRIPFMNLNEQVGDPVQNLGQCTALSTLTFPAVFRDIDWIVSMPKLKTHHWAGVTLSMKNLFGVLPGLYYGWPKNVLHHQGIHESILDIYATLKPHFAIVDGIVGMEGDGPIMGDPKPMGVVVMGRNFPSVDATCARLMGVNPHNIPYLRAAEGWLGAINEAGIEQRGEPIRAHRQDFALLDHIPAQQGLRLNE
ncbi:MAG: (4Fe-4S)-binding protein [Nitrospirales bacterium]|nr:MAG: (4Fe-4S)-binding protein [Nitrospirales bacterium]